MRITINDIAKAAGVSKATVSFAFNDPKRISKDTAEKIHLIAEKLGYFPDPTARSLTSKKVGSLGLLLPQSVSITFKNPYMVELLRGIGDASERHGFSITILPPIDGRIEDAARKAAVDGFLTIGVDPGTRVTNLLQQRKIPYVSMDGKPGLGASNVSINDLEAALSLMAHVLSLGHRNVCVVQLTDDTVHSLEARSSWVRDQRMMGFERALAAFGLNFENPFISTVSAVSSIEGGEEVVDILAAQRKMPSAFVVMADIIALGILSRLKVLGYNVPQDVSIVGFDDLPASTMSSPALTTVSQPSYEKGLQAIEALNDLINGGLPRDIVLPFEMRMRQSTAQASFKR